MLGGEAGEPGVEVAVAELDDAVARAADEVMVMALAAEPVADLAGMVHQRIYDTGLAEEREGAVDSCEADGVAARGEPPVNLLRRGVVRLRGQSIQHREALAR